MWVRRREELLWLLKGDELQPDDEWKDHSFGDCGIQKLKVLKGGYSNFLNFLNMTRDIFPFEDLMTFKMIWAATSPQPGLPNCWSRLFSLPLKSQMFSIIRKKDFIWMSAANISLYLTTFSLSPLRTGVMVKAPVTKVVSGSCRIWKNTLRFLRDNHAAGLSFPWCIEEPGPRRRHPRRDPKRCPGCVGLQALQVLPASKSDTTMVRGLQLQY